MALPIASQLPGWESILFIVLVLVFLATGAVVTFVIMARMRWPFKYVVLENTAGNGYVISRRGRARIVGFGDGGEEIFLLKHLNKYRIGYGKRIGPKQIGWAVGDDGLWYQFNFGNLNKTLRELGVMPVSVNVRLGMSSVRKGLDKRYEEKSWMEKYGMVIGLTFILLMSIVLGGAIWFMSKKNVEAAQITSENLKINGDTMESIQKTLGALDNILSRVNLNDNTQNSTIIGGSGLISNG